MNRIIAIHIMTIVLIICASSLVFGQIFLTNQLARIGADLSTLDQSIASVSRINSSLTNEIASASSLAAVSAKAAGLGFEDKTKVISLSGNDLPVAFNQPRQ